MATAMRMISFHHGSGRDDFSNARFAFCYGASFVHAQGFEFADRFQHGTALDKHTTPRHCSETRYDGHRRQNDQCAWAGDDEQHKAAIEPGEPYAAKEQRRQQHDEHGGDHDGGCVVAGKNINEALRRSLLRLRLLHEMDDLGYGAVGAGFGGADFEEGAEPMMVP